MDVSPIAESDLLSIRADRRVSRRAFAAMLRLLALMLALAFTAVIANAQYSGGSGGSSPLGAVDIPVESGLFALISNTMNEAAAAPTGDNE